MLVWPELWGRAALQGLPDQDEPCVFSSCTITTVGACSAQLWDATRAMRGLKMGTRWWYISRRPWRRRRPTSRGNCGFTTKVTLCFFGKALLSPQLEAILSSNRSHAGEVRCTRVPWRQYVRRAQRIAVIVCEDRPLGAMYERTSHRLNKKKYMYMDRYIVQNTT